MDVQLALCVAWLLTIIPNLSLASVSQPDLDFISSNLDIKVKVEDNLEYDGGRHKFVITLKNAGNQHIRGDNWTIYFYSFFMLEGEHLPRPGGYEVPGQGVRLHHVTGCLFGMAPTATFASLNSMETREVVFFGDNWAVSRSDVPPNWYIASDGLESRLINSTAFGSRFVEDFTSVRQWKRYRTDQYNPYTPRDRTTRYGENTAGQSTKKQYIIPTPKRITETSSQFVSVRTGTWQIRTGSKETAPEGKYLGDLIHLPFNDSNVKVRNTIFLDLDPTLTVSPESYVLTVNRDEGTVVILANHKAGLFYGGQSLASLLAGNDDEQIPEITISDEPHFEFRGMYIDLARNFHDKNDLMRLMTAMAAYKLNKLHLHLADDEGWRIEIPGLPELTQVASNRCHDPNEDQCLWPQLGSGPHNVTSGSGFLTKEDYLEIVRFANERHIEVIPEVDTPGHARAAIIAMEKRFRNLEPSNVTAASEFRLIDPDDTSRYFSVQMFSDNAINPCINSTYRFIAKVMDEIQEMHVQAGQPLNIYHYGGDEVPLGAWVNSTACKNILSVLPPSDDSKYLKLYFLNKTSELAFNRNLSLSGWEDGWMDGAGNPFRRNMFQNGAVMANAWDNVWEWGAAKRAYSLANQGYKVVLSHVTHLYFDHPYEPDPEERGLYWGPRFTDTFKTFGYVTSDMFKNVDVKRSGEIITKAEVCKQDNSGCPPLKRPENIIGLQGHLWSETVLSSQLFDYMIFPRLLAVAERGWHRASWEDIDDESDRRSAIMADWKVFAESLGTKELSRLDAQGIQYRVPPPGARIENDIVFPTVTFQGLSVEYKRNDQSNWMVSTSQGVHFNRSDIIYLRTRSANDSRTSRVVTVKTDPVLKATDQTVIDYIAEKLDVKVEVVDNLQDESIGSMRMTLTNTGVLSIGASSWNIYFDSVRLLQPNHYPYPEGITLTGVDLRLYHVSGSLYRLIPETSFKPFLPGQKLSFLYQAKYWQVARTDTMPNMFVGGEGMASKVIQSTQGEQLQFVGDFTTKNQWKRFVYDQYDPFLARTRHTINSDVTDMGHAGKRLIPTPVTESLTDGTKLTVTADWVVVNSSHFPQESACLADMFNLSITSTRPSAKYIEYQKEAVLVRNSDIVHSEAYKVAIDAENDVIILTANQNAGAFYAMKTLHALSSAIQTGRELPNGTVEDGPRFKYRGMHLDVGRNFHSKAAVIKLLDVMATYKMNKLHFHLSEDEGWRLEIPGLPELTDVGSNRCHDEAEVNCIVPQLGSGPNKSTSGSGYYNVSDYKEILTSAAERHIMVIPEFDMPGHIRAAIKSMEARRLKFPTNETAAKEYILTEIGDPSVYLSVQMFTDNAMNPCLDSTFRFTENVITEVIKMHKDIQPLQMFHFGGDEVAKGAWLNSSACQSFMANTNDISSLSDLPEYFAKRVANQVAARGINVGAWEDGLMKSANDPYDRAMLPNNIDVYGYAWDNVWEWGAAGRAYHLANEGYKVVLAHATHLYFDHPYEPDPEERGFYWATRYTDTRKTFGYIPDNFYMNADVKRSGESLTQEEICAGPVCPTLTKPENIEGIQGQLWTETVRTDEQMDEMIFPRLLALAERAWHKAPWEDLEDKTARNAGQKTDWIEFANTLGYRELSVLDSRGVKYRVPPPGGMSKDGHLVVNSAFPGLLIEVSTDSGKTWKEVKRSTTVTPRSSILLRTKSADSQRTSREVFLTDLSIQTSGSTIPFINVISVLTCIIGCVLQTFL
ncbi:uncharacterized protein LOC110463418 [Mizuhopecten yessoensis]|uniref:beta-N-acetylhexosaminidase n=1 Tax=Mizuhopecten yessoensis TaxID=6573 RepID=A0A210PW89_MIZYE|nr:uncharacterized protein LOC110463418 [Mizuhopecten yessoensis]OWF40739.1 N,N'-diacetylchitobiase [Mizuhopecten yessoensis]